MSRKGLLPSATHKIQGKNFDVRYSSLIARAQRVSDGQNIGRAMQLLQPLFQAKPDLLDPVDTDAVLREVWNIFGIKHGLLLTKRALDDKRKQQAKLQQQQMQQQQEAHQADMANKVAPMMAAMQQGQQQNAPQA